MVQHVDNHYGIVIDAGSSGSRLHIFEWQDPESLINSNPDEEILHSVPQISQDKEWNYKISPGLASYELKPHKAFSKHIRPLLDFAKDIIPDDKIKETPVFVQATAGMRLLPNRRKNKILQNICHGIEHSTEFLLSDCESQVQVIDGETEGLYGWLSLNYLLGHFNNYDASKTEHFTFGFMDMGGASTQIAFAPSDLKEVEKHKDDIATVYLKSIDGQLQEWNVFVSTWLGFGANEARRRYLIQLINSLPENSNNYDDDDYKTRLLTDPCLPKNCKTKFKFKGRDFKFLGSGNYEQCSKSIYPLLMKNLPCSEEPCLFNGVHAPQIDFFKDKFVGTSEYWYTANDVFKLGGTYNFENFSTHVKDFCSSDWEVIEANSKKGLYNSIPTEFLEDSCFKANWVLNVLHEGFGLPRVGIDAIDKEDNEDEHPLFQSAVSVEDRELSWTLGRILLYASGVVEGGRVVGIEPSARESSLLGKTFIPGAMLPSNGSKSSTTGIFKILAFATLIMLCFVIIRNTSTSNWKNAFSSIRSRTSKFKYLKIHNDPQSQLEEGTFQKSGSNVDDDYDGEGCKFRSKSMFNLNLAEEQERRSPGYPMRYVSASASSSPTVPVISSPAPPHTPKTLRTAFSLADFSKFKDGKFSD